MVLIQPESVCDTSRASVTDRAIVNNNVAEGMRDGAMDYMDD